MKDKAFLTLYGLFFVVLIAGVAIVTLDGPTNSISRASNKNPSPNHSFVAIFPQIGTVGNEQTGVKPAKIKVAVTIRDINGTILKNRTIKLSASLSGITISPSDTLTTDAQTNQAIFYLTSKEPGTARLKITDVNSNIDLTNVPTVEFTE